MGNTLRRVYVTLSRERYQIHVYTGDRKGAGTGSNVYLRLRDRGGFVTPPLLLAGLFQSRLERGTVSHFALPHHGRLRDIESLVLRRDTAGHDDDWFLELVEVDDRETGAKHTFPVHRWIPGNAEFRLRPFDTSLPQDDDADMLARRQSELAGKRRRYQYTQFIDFGPVQIKQFPEDEMFSFSYQYGFDRERAQLLNQTAAIGSTEDRWTSFTELMAAVQNTLGRASAMEFWKTDQWFAMQRLQGVNPLLITLLTEMPDNLDVNDELLQPFLEGFTIEEALEKKKLFVVDLKLLEGIQTEDDKHLCAPIALFYLNKEAKLLPIAIQLFQEKGPENPAFVPTDPPNLWLLVKMFFNNAEAQHHQACSHLGFTHLMMEGVAICTNRNLSPSHPLFRLLAPHFLHLIAINRVALEKLISPGGWVDTAMTIGADGLKRALIKGMAEWRLDTWARVPAQLKARGVDDPAVLPTYPYRDDATAIYGILRCYVREVVECWYREPTRLAGDWELQQWRRELTRPRADGGVGLRGVPGDDDTGFNTVDELVDTMTDIISVCSLQHAAVNFGMYEAYGFVPNYPATLHGPPPTARDAELTKAELLNFLPGRGVTREVLTITKLLCYRGTRSLGDFEVRFLYDPVCVAAAEAMQEQLREHGQRVRIRNRTNDFAYESLEPTTVPNSISI